MAVRQRRPPLTVIASPGKILVPFITHGGYGTGSAPETLAAIAADAQILEPFIQECDAERDTLRQISAWLENLP